MDVGTNANVTFQALSSLVKQAHLVVFSCQRCSLSYSPPLHLSTDPLVLPSAEVAGGWKQGNWDQSLSHCHYQFCPDNWSAFFYFHPSNVGGREGCRGGISKREGWRTWKRAPFFSLLTLKKCGVISCQGVDLSEEDTHAVEPMAAACVWYIQSIIYFIIYEHREKLWRLLWKQLFSSDFRSAEGLHVGEGPLSWSLMTIRRHGAFGDMWALQAWVALPHHTLGCNKYQHCNFTPVIIIVSSITDRESSTHLL